MCPRPLHRSEVGTLTKLQLRGMGLHGLRYWAAWPLMFFNTHLIAGKTSTDGSSYLTISPPRHRALLLFMLVVVLIVIINSLNASDISVPGPIFWIAFGLWWTMAVMSATLILSLLLFALAAPDEMRTSLKSSFPSKNLNSEVPRGHWKVGSLVKSPEAPSGSGLSFAREAILKRIPPGDWFVATARTSQHATAYERMGMKRVSNSLLLVGQVPPP